jgi:hypothetical protein
MWNYDLIQDLLKPLSRTSGAVLRARIICGDPAHLGNHRVLADVSDSDSQP